MFKLKEEQLSLFKAMATEQTKGDNLRFFTVNCGDCSGSCSSGCSGMCGAACEGTCRGSCDGSEGCGGCLDCDLGSCCSCGLC